MKRKIKVSTIIAVIMLALTLFSTNSYSIQTSLPGTSGNGWYDTVQQSISFNSLSSQIWIDFDGDHSTFAYARPAGWSINWGTYGEAGIGHTAPGWGTNTEWYLMFGEWRMGATSAHANHVAAWDTEWFYLFLSKTETPTDFIVSFQMSDGLTPIPVTTGFWYTTTQGAPWNHFDPSIIPEPENTQPGDDVQVSDPETGTTILFETVDSGGETTVTQTSIGEGPPPPTGLKIVPLGVYYEINTTAVFSGLLQIAIEYDDTGLTAGQESALKLRCYEAPEWVDITKWLDTVNNIIYGETNHLSFFAVTYNLPPLIDAINAPPAPVQVNTTVEASASFSDPDDGDTHTSEWDWGDGASSAGTVDEASEIVSGSHMYTTAGVYTVTLTVTDEANASGEAVFEYVVVYDASAGFVTGGGWIYSPEGAYIYDPSLTGKANFGFVSKYKKGATVPTGNTEFVFKAADLNFHSSSYDWLVVTGSDYARFKGWGSINGEGGYRFMLWAGDAPDTFRIRIWEEDEASDDEWVVYDNGANQAIGGGSIVVHTK